jgi:hypothetical protein
MPKRIIAAIIGAFAVVAGIVACGYTYEVARDFGNPEVSFWPNVLGTVLMGTIALGGLTFGMRFLRFALLGRTSEERSRLSAVLLGLGCFFPGFVFSAPFAILWGLHKSHGNDQSDETGLIASLFIGVAAAIVGCVVLLRRRRRAAIESLRSEDLSYIWACRKSNKAYHCREGRVWDSETARNGNFIHRDPLTRALA